eukprot:15467265-Alexandrium_andersonii.AAC.1
MGAARLALVGALLVAREGLAQAPAQARAKDTRPVLQAVDLPLRDDALAWVRKVSQEGVRWRSAGCPPEAAEGKAAQAQGATSHGQRAHVHARQATPCGSPECHGYVRAGRPASGGQSDCGCGGQGQRAGGDRGKAREEPGSMHKRRP